MSTVNLVDEALNNLDIGDGLVPDRSVKEAIKEQECELVKSTVPQVRECIEQHGLNWDGIRNTTNKLKLNDIGRFAKTAVDEGLLWGMWNGCPTLIVPGIYYSPEKVHTRICTKEIPSNYRKQHFGFKLYLGLIIHNVPRHKAAVALFQENGDRFYHYHSMSTYDCTPSSLTGPFYNSHTTNPDALLDAVFKIRDDYALMLRAIDYTDRGHAGHDLPELPIEDFPSIKSMSSRLPKSTFQGQHIIVRRVDGVNVEIKTKYDYYADRLPKEVLMKILFDGTKGVTGHDYMEYHRTITNFKHKVKQILTN